MRSSGLRTSALVGLAVALVAASIAVGWRWRHDRGAAGLDFYNFWVAGQLVGRADVTDLYSDETQERIGEEFFERGRRSGSEIHQYDATRRRRLFLTATPFLYAFFAGVSDDYVASLKFYRGLSLAAFVLAVMLIGRTVRLPLWASLAAVAVLAILYRPLEADLRVANVNCVQLLMIALVLWLLVEGRGPGGWAAAAFVLALAITFKPNVALIAPLLVASRIRERDWRRLKFEVAGGAAGAILAIVVAAACYEGVAVWQHWFSSAQGLWELLPDARARNVAPALPLFQRFGPAAGYVLIVLLAAIAVARRASPVAAGILIYLLAGTVVWLHYLVLAVAPALIVLRRRPAVAVVALVLMAEMPFEWLTRLPAQPHEVPMIAIALALLYLGVVTAEPRTRDTVSPQSG